MKKFILKCMMAVSIPLLCILPFLIVGFYSKEMYSPDKLIQLHLESPEDTKFGLAYTDPAPYYKFKNIVIREPKVLALGTSCVLQLKGSFFNEGQFYNGGRGVKNINEFLDYMEAVEELFQRCLEWRSICFHTGFKHSSPSYISCFKRYDPRFLSKKMEFFHSYG